MATMIVYATRLRDRFRNQTTREGVLLRGPAGWGEFSPFWDYDDVACVPWLRAAVAAATQPFPTQIRTQIPVNATVPAVTPSRARQIVAAAGCATVKIKVAQAGQSLTEDLNRVAAVRDVLGPSGHIRVDANAAWSLPEAAWALPALNHAAGGLQYAEQPVARVDDLARLRRRISVPIAADESIRRASDPLAVKRAQAADVIVMKTQPLGGVAACLELAAEIELPVVVSSALESSVGIAQGLALAAALPQLDFACGLATACMFTQDVTTTPLNPAAGMLPAGRVCADTVPPADAKTFAAWRSRLQRVSALAGIKLKEALACPQ